IASRFPCSRHLFRIKRRTPFGINAYHLRPVAGRHVRHAPAEESVYADECRVSRLDQVGEAGFHARHSSAGQGDSESILRAVDFAEAHLDLTKSNKQLRIEMADRRARQ